MSGHFTRWRSGSALFALAGAAALLTGCDDGITVKPEDRRLALGLTRRSVCPDQNATNQEGAAEVVATVFARDGVVAPGVLVAFSVDFAGARLDPGAANTDAFGRARTTLRSVRPPGDKVRLTAQLETGVVATVTQPFPTPPFLTFYVADSSPNVGDAVAMEVVVDDACNIREIRGEITYDPAVLQYLPGEERERGLLNEAPCDPVELCLTVTEPEPGRLVLDYWNTEGRGVSISGSYLQLLFTAAAPGQANLAIVPSGTALLASVGDPYPLYPPDADARAAISTVTVEGAAR